jgi:ATP-dependent protease ClpP protease subunit
MSTIVKKELSSEQHTLYSEIINEKKIPVDKEKNIYRVIPKHKRYRIFIGRFFELKKGLHAVFNELLTADKNDRLEFRINSRGGFVNEGILFYNIIQEKFCNRTTSYLDNFGYSMGALLFCMAHKRVIYPYSDLMFHTYSTVISGKSGELKSRFNHSDKKIKKFFKDIILKKGFLTKEEFKQMLVGQDFWMDAKQMCKRGIATHVIVEGKEYTAKEYLKELKKAKNTKE